MKRILVVLLLAACLVACHTDVKSISTKSDGRTIEQRLYALNIGEAYDISEHETFLRVPGGWVFHLWSGYGVAATFIPLPDEGSR
jgi:hypothetical protein